MLQFENFFHFTWKKKSVRHLLFNYVLSSLLLFFETMKYKITIQKLELLRLSRRWRNIYTKNIQLQSGTFPRCMKLIALAVLFELVPAAFSSSEKVSTYSKKKEDRVCKWMWTVFSLCGTCNIRIAIATNYPWYIALNFEMHVAPVLMKLAALIWMHKHSITLCWFGCNSPVWKLQFQSRGSILNLICVL